MPKREPASFWRENVIAIVILLRVLAKMSVAVTSQWLIIFQVYSIKNNRASFSGKGEYNEAFRRPFFYAKNVSSTFVLVVALSRTRI